MILTLLVVAHLNGRPNLQETTPVQTTQDAYYLQPARNLQVGGKRLKMAENGSKRQINNKVMCNLVYLGALKATGEFCGLDYKN